MNNRKWTVKEADPTVCKKIEEITGFLPLTARLLANRGLDTAEKIKNFLERDAMELYDPFLLTDMDKAVERINRAVANRERICIYGDYDVDGVTSTVLLYSYLCSKGVECEYFIPERISEGYGLSLPVIEKMKGRIDLIITVDTGVTAVAEAEYAKSMGIEMVITDHHSCREVLPDVCAVINPHREDCSYPFCNLAGVGVVFKLLCALEGDTQKILDEYSDIIAVGTIADVMPIIDENRKIASLGLKKLANTKNKGLLALMRHAGIIKFGKPAKKITSATVGYVLAPRINAAGRIAFASRAVELLLTNDDREADEIAAELCEINKLRQTTEQKIYEQAVSLISQSGSDDRFIVLGYEGWHQGVIGVVASKIAEKYSRPCILFSIDGDTAKGSGRSIKGFSLMDALTACGDMLTEYGGHELAAGLSIESSKIDEFRNRINSYASPFLEKNDSLVTLEIECEVNLSDITEKGVDQLLMLEPFGLSNPQPVMVLRNMVLEDVVPLSMGKHMRFRLAQRPCGRSLDVNAVWFGMQESVFPYREGDVCDVVFTADINEYMNRRVPQVFVKAMALSEKEEQTVADGYAAFERLVAGEGNDQDVKSIPNLSDFRTIFRFLKREATRETKKFSLASVARNIAYEFETQMTVCKLLIALKVLDEQKLIKLDVNGNKNSIELALLPTAGKINIDQSELLCRIRSSNQDSGMIK